MEVDTKLYNELIADNKRLIDALLATKRYLAANHDTNSLRQQMLGKQIDTALQWNREKVMDAVREYLQERNDIDATALLLLLDKVA